MNYRETYEKMSDDELLNVAASLSSLVPEAQSALSAELARRELSRKEIEEYQGYLDAAKPGEWPGKKRYVAQSYQGCGTGIYGKRDFQPDGSFVTTQWIVVFWLPIAPLKSMRLLRLRSGAPGATDGNRATSRMLFSYGFWSRQYAVYSETRPIAKQVLCVYGFVLAVFLPLAALICAPWQLVGALLGIVCIAPLLLRGAARKRIQSGFESRDSNDRDC